MRKARRKKRGEIQVCLLILIPNLNRQTDSEVTKSVIKLSKIVAASVAWVLNSLVLIYEVQWA